MSAMPIENKTTALGDVVEKQRLVEEAINAIMHLLDRCYLTAADHADRDEAVCCLADIRQRAMGEQQRKP